jgi:hypothetical protein
MPIAIDHQPILTVTHLRDRECPSALVVGGGDVAFIDRELRRILEDT